VDSLCVVPTVGRVVSEVDSYKLSDVVRFGGFVVVLGKLLAE
jgi:hypothetical protein